MLLFRTTAVWRRTSVRVEFRAFAITRADVWCWWHTVAGRFDVVGVVVIVARRAA